MKTSILLVALLLAGSVMPGVAQAQDEAIPKKYRETVAKGRKWLTEQQHKDGYWSGTSGQYPVAVTGLAGIALLAEGSTIREGKYAGHIRRAVDWLMQRSQKNNRYDGLLGDPSKPTEAGRYMFGHGYALLFLCQVYGEVEDAKLRARLGDVLKRAVQFSADAQSTRGGWFYTSAKEGHDSDEGVVTVVQLHALREARNTGLAVPKAVLQKARDYLKKCTTEKGGVVYTLPNDPKLPLPAGGERAAITAAALADLIHAGEFQADLSKKWLKYCRNAIPVGGAPRLGADEFVHYYYAQVVYRLGDDGWKKLFGEAQGDEVVTWSKYRQVRFDYLMKTQLANGSWDTTWGVGPVYPTAMNLTIMQLDNTRLALSR